MVRKLAAIGAFFAGVVCGIDNQLI